MSLINSIMQEHKCYSIYHMTFNLIKNYIFGMKTSRFCHFLGNIIMDVIRKYVNHKWFMDFIAWHYTTPRRDIL